MNFNVITIFPKIIFDYLDETVLARAQKNNLIKVNPVNLRDFTSDNHKTVDDTPYGGGAGMVMKPEPIFKALASLDALTSAIGKQTSALAKLKIVMKSVVRSPKSKKTILLSPRGKQFDQRMAEELSKLDEITFVCGRYEGVDQRVTDFMVDEEVSIGPYVLAGGELGALVIIEAVARLVPGVLGNQNSLREETFGSQLQIANCKLQNGEANNSEIRNLKSEIEYAQYTKPADFMGWKVPEVLLSGNHQKIKEWRENKQME
jgi:tRNA (guanine37-N1)-methyltransferase